MVAVPLGVEVGATVPHGVAEHDTAQVTPLFAKSLVTAAVNCAVDPACTVAEEGATVTTTEGTVIVAEANFVVSVADVAVRVTVRLLDGGVAGAV